MGHRANFVVIESGTARAYIDNWAALGCLHGFSEGPDAAIAVLADYERSNELLDWAFAEGGYLIDLDDRRAIVFGPWMDESDFDFDYEESADSSDVEDAEEFNASQYLSDIAGLWAGWKLTFDDRGVDAFADYMKEKQISGINTQPKSHPADVAPSCHLQA